jgi:hypothetical protein
MNAHRSAFDWLIILVNAGAVLLGLAIGSLWFAEGARNYVSDDNISSLRVGVCVGFLMAYLVWNAVVTTFLILKIRALVRRLDDEAPVTVTAFIPEAVQPPTVVAAAPPSSPSPRPMPPAGAPASSVPGWVGDLAQANADVPELANNQALPPASWIADVESEENARRGRKE